MKFILRKWKHTDAPSLAFYANDPQIARNLRKGFPSPYTLEDAEAFIKLAAGEDETKNLYLTIDIDGKAVGSIGVFCRTGKSAELGYWLGKPYWGKGIISQAISEICRDAFTKFPIDEIFAEPYVWNKGSQRALEKNGFTFSGSIGENCTYILRKNNDSECI